MARRRKLIIHEQILKKILSHKEYNHWLITDLSFVFQKCGFVCPQVQKDSKAVHLLMSIRCKIDVISLKLKQIGWFTKRLLRLYIFAPYIRKIYGRVSNELVDPG